MEGVLWVGPVNVIAFLISSFSRLKIVSRTVGLPVPADYTRLFLAIDCHVIDEIMIKGPSFTMVVVAKFYGVRACRDREYG